LGCTTPSGKSYAAWQLCGRAQGDVFGESQVLPTGGKMRHVESVSMGRKQFKRL